MQSKSTMKTKVTQREKQPLKDVEQKFLEEQSFSEQGFHLVDPKNEDPEITDENGITPTDSEESSDEIGKEE